MPSLKKYPCESCDYIGINRRMLARHFAVVHSKKVFRCPLCPFITRYAANWYRHKRHLHGLSRFNTCEVCGFFANSPLELSQHKEREHPERVALHPALGPLNPSFSAKVNPEQDVYNFQLSPAISIQEINKNLEKHSQNTTAAYNPDKNAENISVLSNESITFSLPTGGHLLENDTVHSPSIQDKIHLQESFVIMNSFNNNNVSNLKPLKIRRSYCCDLCGFLTGSPREFLYHQRDGHNMRMNIFECELCIYASKHIQKLQRHYGLVHRQKKNFDVPSILPPKESNESPVVNNNNSSLISNMQFLPFDQSSPLPIPTPPNSRPKREKPGLISCTMCSYHTKNKVLMNHHEKTVHFKKKTFQCDQCGYTTSEKIRFTKHLKYHNLSKMQCEFCHFKSAYKWNMDRHMRSHMSGAVGEYNCTLCNFVTHSKQSLKFHSSNHHEQEYPEYDEEMHEMEPESEIVSDKSGEMILDDGDWLNQDEDEFDNNNANTSHINPENIKNSNLTWQPQQETPPTLHCSLCNFKTTWPFEMKKHEDMHKSDKKHACPMCGMRFEHIAWLTKHLHRVHPENSEAQDLAAAYELMKPARRKAGVNQSSPLKQIGLNAKTTKLPKQTLLSSYLKSPPNPSQKYSYQPPKDELLRKALKQPEPQYKFSLPEAASESPIKKKPLRRLNACPKCSYKTKWASELERHMRVHTEEKPFHCTRCNYHSKWKGDLTRHIAKYHGCKLPIQGKLEPLPKLRLKKAVPDRASTPDDWETVNEDSFEHEERPSNVRKEDDSPLDLSTSKPNIFRPYLSRPNGIRSDIGIRGRRSSISNQNLSNSGYSSGTLQTPERLEPESKNFPEVISKDHSKSNGLKKKYFCPFCPFNTSTPSRFHVHIIQHYNRRPFMCSVCGHNSNWEWDITKHIRLKGCKDKDHNNACVLLTHESGRRNYEKYDKYLRETRSKAGCSTKISTKIRVDWQDQPDTENYTSPTNSTVVSEMLPENIVVTPDLPFSQDAAEKLDVNSTHNSNEQSWKENSDMQNGNFKFFQCKHCNYKHASKKVVVSHLSAHAGVRPFRCRACGFTSSWRNVVVQHVKSAHNGYMNDVEDRITYVQEGFVIRITSIKNNKFSGVTSVNKKASYNCKFCPYKCDKEVYIKFHMKQHKPKEGALYQCSICPYYVKFKRTLVRHLKLHETTENSGSCDASYSMANENEEMNSQNENDETYPTSNYNYSYEQNSSQENFEDENSVKIDYNQLKVQDNEADTSLPEQPKLKRKKEKKHVCDNCPYRTDNRTAYLYHKQFHRPNASAPFKCTICTYWATMQHLLTQHMKVHQNSLEESLEDESTYCSPDNQHSSDSNDVSPRGTSTSKVFKCRYCPMSNKKKANVRIHEKMHAEHANDGKINCHLCSYKCAGQGNLTNHLKLHHSSKQDSNSTVSYFTDSTPVNKKKVFSYFCMKCPAVFKSSSDLFIHKTFHGSSLAFPCPQCDYRAKHRIHLQKHLQVHTDEYIAKRDASFGPPVPSEGDESHSNSPIPQNAIPSAESGNKKVDQMLLLELAEVRAFLYNPKIRGKLQKCQYCPAGFAKLAILIYHQSLHGSNGQFGCSQCNYATTNSANLTAHAQVHSKPVTSTRRLSRTLQCPNCPAIFEKYDRFERHVNLHGKDNRFSCDLCDYSVNCAANLTKHRLVHERAEAAVGEGNDDNDADGADLMEASSNQLLEPIKPIDESDSLMNATPMLPDMADDRKAFVCERCPYFQMRKDAVINHQSRHYQKEGLHCPYCDYRVIGLSFLQNHVRSHITPTNVFAPQFNAKFNKFEIFYMEEGNKVIVFEDKGSELEIPQRFFPPLNNVDILNQSSEAQVNVSSSNSNEVSELSVSNESFNKEDTVSNSRNASPTSDVLPEYQPKVVLTDIFSTHSTSEITSLVSPKSSKENDQNEIEKMSKTKPKAYVSTTSQNESPTNGSCKNSKSSIIVKIKVENNAADNNEKYSISNEQVDQSGSAENLNHESEMMEVDVSDDKDVQLPGDSPTNCDTETDKNIFIDSSKTLIVMPDQQNACDTAPEIPPEDILKQSNSIVNGVEVDALTA